MSKKKKDDLEQYENITVANMNVEGMPWYTKDAGERMTSGKPEESADSPAREELTPKETRHLIANAVVAALLVGGVFLLAIFLFLLFCVYVWF
ncbi:hypothetical protein [Kineothrix sp. MB12-C1]|uniref:hypothetical protein n=1 Tax=Kineothrix sp. MB12-C1 TaxID=3070215 RepID=UPI0027D2026D|nr:hypothetical protein [Kineothrix sp. MB12-C1]WMC94265.1 hypothetical protein RBB56_08410 [Kineothrix sp. MB12-C1]